MPEHYVPPVIFILSGGVGSSGEQLVNTVLAQFPDNSVETRTVGNIRTPEQVTRALIQAKRTSALVVHTLVDEKLSRQVAEEARAMGIRGSRSDGTVDRLGVNVLEMEPLQQPGKYRQLHREYYDRVAAIDLSWPTMMVKTLTAGRRRRSSLSAYRARARRRSAFTWRCWAGKLRTSRSCRKFPFPRAYTGLTPPG